MQTMACALTGRASRASWARDEAFYLWQPSLRWFLALQAVLLQGEQQLLVDNLPAYVGMARSMRPFLAVQQQAICHGADALQVCQPMHSLIAAPGLLCQALDS